MNEKIKQYITQSKQNELIDQGFYKKDYITDEEYKNNKQEGNFFYDTIRRQYYKQIPLDITDEEFEALMNVKYYGKKKSILPGWLDFIGVLIILLGVIAGIYSEDFLTFLLGCVGAIATGILFFALGRIIMLLEDIKRK